VDKKTWDEIEQMYGPNGLLGYDLANGNAEITSYTQLATFVCNGLMLGAIRQNPDKYGRYILLGLREWLKSQQPRVNPEKTFCWVAQVPDMRRRLCMDTRMLDALAREQLGTPDKPVYHSDTPSAMTAAVAVGLLFDPERMTREQLGTLGTYALAFTHGEKESFLAGALLAYGIAGILAEPEKKLAQVFSEAAQAVTAQFGERFPEAGRLQQRIEYAIELTRDPELSPLASLSLLRCTTAAECLAGAVYCSVIHPGNFDEGMIAAVNHSGHSAAVGALTGAILGAKLGCEALPEFYLESLEQAPILGELACDIAQGKQFMRIFDDDWDQKYNQGMPIIQYD
jgi:ADP-ribosylglycohydrolase